MSMFPIIEVFETSSLSDNSIDIFNSDGFRLVHPTLNYGINASFLDAVCIGTFRAWMDL